MYAASLWLSNSSYLYLSVSFIQMTKSLMPGLVYCCGIAFGVERFTSATAANMVLIAFGVAVCAFGEVNLILKGVVQQLSALLFEVSLLVACLGPWVCILTPICFLFVQRFLHCCVHTAGCWPLLTPPACCQCALQAFQGH